MIKRSTWKYLLEGSEVVVAEDRWNDAPGDVAGIEEDEEVYCGCGGEVESCLGVRYYEVEAEVDAPEGEEEAWVTFVLDVFCA